MFNKYRLIIFHDLSSEFTNHGWNKRKEVLQKPLADHGSIMTNLKEEDCLTPEEFHQIKSEVESDITPLPISGVLNT